MGWNDASCGLLIIFSPDSGGMPGTGSPAISFKQEISRIPSQSFPGRGSFFPFIPSVHINRHHQDMPCPVKLFKDKLRVV